MLKTLFILVAFSISPVGALAYHPEYDPISDNPVINLSNEQTQVLLSSEKTNLVPSIVCDQGGCQIEFQDIDAQMQETIGL